MKSEYYAEKQRITATLAKQFPQGSCPVTSTGKQGAPGRVCMATVENSARLILEGTHRLATPQEFEAWQATMAMNKARSVPVNGLEAARALFAALQGGKDAAHK